MRRNYKFSAQHSALLGGALNKNIRKTVPPAHRPERVALSAPIGGSAFAASPRSVSHPGWSGMSRTSLSWWGSLPSPPLANRSLFPPLATRSLRSSAGDARCRQPHFRLDWTPLSGSFGRDYSQMGVKHHRKMLRRKGFLIWDRPAGSPSIRSATISNPNGILPYSRSYIAGPRTSVKAFSRRSRGQPGARGRRV